MNTIGIALVWCALQVTLACSAGAAVYFVARKMHWAAGRMTTIVSLAMVLALSATAFSPWPSWLALDSGQNEPAAALSDQKALQKSERSDVDADLAASQPSLQSGPLNIDFWQSLWVEMQQTQATDNATGALASNAWRWPAMVVCLFLVAATVGVIRLFLAWLAVRRLDRRSTILDDRSLQQLVATIREELSPTRPVVLKESPELQTAATFGWRRPVILLPLTWRDWPLEERCAVLAHELAHIRAGDFPMWLLAQVVVAMHFYHPLVHWLAGRLRLEQELAADATAARFAGGRETYLQSLAALTLRADYVRPGWAAQTFLPTRSMFVRRIEMLKQTKSRSPGRLSGRVRLAVVGALMAIGVLAVGLRSPGPMSATRVVAAEPTGDQNETVTLMPQNSSAGRTQKQKNLDLDMLRRMQSLNNLREIALACLFYQNDHGHYPPVVLHDKKTGTPYSWRVAILPYMSQKALYNRYHFDEPWDSESNREVLEHRPIQLFFPTKHAPTNNAPYFVLTGSETAFPEEGGTKIKQITDGTVSTILVVEAKRDIPWTKPEDIPYSPNKPLPKLGGFFDGGFGAATCDGYVRFLSDDIDPQMLRNLIEKADGNVVDRSEFQK